MWLLNSRCILKAKVSQYQSLLVPHFSIIIDTSNDVIERIEIALLHTQSQRCNLVSHHN